MSDKYFICYNASMSQTSSVYRTIEILERLNSGKKLCVQALAMEYEVSDRTIRRDFNLIREIFGNFLSKEGECYQAYKKVLLDDVLRGSELMTLANIVNLFSATKKSSHITDKTHALIKQSTSIYDFKSRPFENLTNHHIVKELEYAISFKREVIINYRTQRGTFKAHFHPYKIIFLNENFYLVGINASKDNVEYRRVSMIQEVIQTKNSFYVDAKVEAFFTKIQTPWADFKQEEITIKLIAEVSIKRYFLKKKYLPSQEIVREFKNGEIEIHYTITSFREIEELIIKWLPRLRIIAPTKLKKVIKRELEFKLKGLKHRPTQESE